ncbi:O-methyltransferase 1, chloroplastic [Amaranthus tricolor]|uniref:O-methyltransferase 1, chloroplastic n=1 Tax=Amaranthus tricolor TaxID=29722 RepID=UPI00258CC368|nr:O-methyltransferase 1, chloroplastic [Amaranthus tricolor]
MEALHGLSYPSFFPKVVHGNCSLKKWRNRCSVTALSGDDDLLFKASLRSATLRFQETNRPDPLFHDPYVACLVPGNTPIYTEQHVHRYCLATRFIDDTLLQTLRNTEELKQVVLLTDGADTRAYRLTWPNFTLIFDISRVRIYCEVSQKLRDIGAQINRTCLLLHVSSESSNIAEELRKKGFNGNRPSLWVLQGLPLTTLANFEDVLCAVGSLAMKGSLVIGELPAWLAGTDFEQKISQREWMHTLFMRHGFQVQMIDCEDVAKSLGRKLSRETSSNMLFVAEHLRFSDDQMEMWQREFQMAEEDGDEEGFEDF